MDESKYFCKISLSYSNKTFNMRHNGANFTRRYDNGVTSRAFSYPPVTDVFNATYQILFQTRYVRYYGYYYSYLLVFVHTLRRDLSQEIGSISWEKNNWIRAPYAHVPSRKTLESLSILRTSQAVSLVFMYFYKLKKSHLFKSRPN